MNSHQYSSPVNPALRFSLGAFAFFVVFIGTMGRISNAQWPEFDLTANSVENDRLWTEAITTTTYLPAVEYAYLPTAPLLPTKILFVSDYQSAGVYDLYEMNLDGTNLKRLTYLELPLIDDELHEVLELMPASWSPDGSEIAFVYGQNLHLMKADGSNQTVLTAVSNSEVRGQPRWSPDGKYIGYFVNFPLSDSVHMYKTEEQQSKIIETFTFDGPFHGSFDWFPDSQSLLTTGSGIPNDQLTYFVFKVAVPGGAGEKFLPSYQYQGAFMFSKIRVSPDGKKAAVLEGGNRAIQIIDIESREISRIRLPHRNLFDMVWHPNSRHLAIVGFDNFNEGTSLYRVDTIAGRVAHYAAAGSDSRKWVVGWSSNGEKLIFSSDAGNTKWLLDIYAIDFDGYGLKNLTAGLPHMARGLDIFP